MTHVDVETIAHPEPALGGKVWNTFTPDTRITAREYVDTIAVLLQGVLASNGHQQPEVLIEQLRVTLGLHGPHSALPMPNSPSRPVQQLLTQALRINDALVTWAGEALNRLIAQPEPLNEPLLVRSHCDGHTLIPPAVHILLGPQGGPVPMMLYNEWIHQMVLLRDALLPFSNFAEVPLPVDGAGLRRLERSRDSFLAELLVRQIRHATIVDHARAVLVPGHDEHVDGYGFAWPGGTVLPTVVTAPSVLTQTHLLTWSPETTVPEGVTTYVPSEPNYYEAPRAVAGAIAREGETPSVAGATARVVASSSADGRSHAAIEITDPRGDFVASIDLGQALRGHRYAYPTAGCDEASASGASEWIAGATSLSAVDVLTADGMVWDESGDYVIDAGQDGLVALALLGSVYPENVVLREASDPRSPAAVGKTGPARFVVTLPDRPHV